MNDEKLTTAQEVFDANTKVVPLSNGWKVRIRKVAQIEFFELGLVTLPEGRGAKPQGSPFPSEQIAPTDADVLTAVSYTVGLLKRGVMSFTIIDGDREADPEQQEVHLRILGDKLAAELAHAIDEFSDLNIFKLAEKKDGGASGDSPDAIGEKKPSSRKTAKKTPRRRSRTA